MSEEEKKAIEWLKNATFFSARIYAPTILNLIEQQQKEIECLNVIHESYKEMIEENNYISKDKIREKIKKEEKHQETTKKLFPDSLNYHMQKYAVEVLKELLEG